MRRGSFLPILAAGLLIIVASGFILFKTFPFSQKSQSQENSSMVNDADMQILDFLPKWVPEAEWQPSEKSISTFREKQLDGVLRRAILTRNDTYFFGFGDEEYLKSLGWIEGDLSADMPGGRAWNYVKYIEGEERILILSYQNRSLILSPKGGVEAKCPCSFNLEVFLSDPF